MFTDHNDNNRKEGDELRVLLVDGMSFLYRAFYSTKIERNSKGEPINALKRYLYLLNNFNIEYPCDEIIVCEDAPLATLYRQKLFSGYKKGRKPPPPEMLSQKGLLFGILRKIGFPVIGITGYEADDIIGTLSKELAKSKHFVLIASPDKDMYQLLTSDRIGMIQHNPNTKSQQLLFRDDIKRITGYDPEQVIDLKILAGDSSDNIPGVPSCGPKNAVKILQKYGSIQGLMESNGENPMEQSVIGYIRKHRDEIESYRSIIQIDRSIDMDIISKQLSYRVTEQIVQQTMERYELLTPDEFCAMSYYEYLMSRLDKGGN